MPIYKFEALKGKETLNGRIEADNIKEAREILRKNQLIPTELVEAGASDTDSLLNKKIGKISSRDKIDFTNTLYVLSKTGISLVEALMFIEKNSGSKNIRILAIQLRKMVMKGASLSEAVAKYPKIFDPVYCGLVRAGEEAGEIDSTLKRMVELLDKQDSLKSKMIATMSYPGFIVLLSVAVTLIMLIFVFPAFQDMYSQVGKDLPVITKILMDTGIFLKQYWYIIPVSFVALGYSLYFIYTWEKTKRIIDTIILKTPLFNNFIKLGALSNFMAVLKIAFDAGVPILDSLHLSNFTVQNYKIKDSIKDVTVKIQQGQTLSTALKSTNIIPSIIMCMISTGEESGQLGDMLSQSTEYIDEQLDRVMELLNKLLEPALLVVVGGVVLVLALSLYLPLFQSYTNMM